MRCAVATGSVVILGAMCACLSGCPKENRCEVLRREVSSCRKSPADLEIHSHPAVKRMFRERCSWGTGEEIEECLSQRGCRELLICVTALKWTPPWRLIPRDDEPPPDVD
jgi:hypothetical protein